MVFLSVEVSRGLRDLTVREQLAQTAADAAQTPRSVISPVTRRAGVTSKAGLRAGVVSGEICTSVVVPSASLP